MGGFSLPAGLKMPAQPFQPEPVEGDSLTKALRSTTNLAGGTGTNFLNAGTDVFNAGVGGAGTAGGTASTALATVDPVVAYWKAILSGDPKAVNTAISPAAGTLATAYQNAIKNAQMFMPRGGARASIVSQLPFQQGQDLFNLVAQLQPMAAQGLNQTANTQIGAGGLQTELARALMSGGLGVTGQGTNLLNTVLQTMLARRGQNVTADMNSPLNKMLGSLASIPGAFAGGLAGKVFNGIGGGGSSGGGGSTPDIWGGG